MDLLEKVIEELSGDHAFRHIEKISEQKLIEMLRECTSANLVGEKAVTAGIKAGVIEEKNVKLVSGVPHAQYVLVTV